MILPFERVTTHGRDALQTWEGLRDERRGSPVIVGGDESLQRLMEQYELSKNETVAETLARAATHAHPASLIALHAAERVQFEEISAKLPPMPEPRAMTSEESLARFGVDLTRMVAPPAPPKLEPGAHAPSMARDSRGGHLERVTILILPTQDPTEAPAWLNWGDWNACPPPDYHVAALRSWRDRFGAEFIGLGPDRMNLRVQRRPDTQQAALALAGEHYTYCPDIVDQGVGTVTALADELLASDWWDFWWD